MRTTVQVSFCMQDSLMASVEDQKLGSLFDIGIGEFGETHRAEEDGHEYDLKLIYKTDNSLLRSSWRVCWAIPIHM